jgi:hypothetical protein
LTPEKAVGVQYDLENSNGRSKKASLTGNRDKK